MNNVKRRLTMRIGIEQISRLRDNRLSVNNTKRIRFRIISNIRFF